MYRRSDRVQRIHAHRRNQTSNAFLDAPVSRRYHACQACHTPIQMGWESRRDHHAVSGQSRRTAVILQPGYLPWLGFFDQAHRSDVFIYYDDVQFDQHGWRNRNR
ncbi:MAG TPA: WbqC family protein, partial [bacterium]|nr:WbqC family protein [bacterium]